jgi:hypothetical protein
MEHVYWTVILIVECITGFYGVRWAVKTTAGSYAPLQPANAVIYALGVAAVMVSIAALAYFFAFDFLGFKIPLIRKC